eukprot:2517757-Prymnesium_polylepis.1
MSDETIDELVASTPYFRWTKEMQEQVAIRLQKLRLFQEAGCTQAALVMMLRTMIHQRLKSGDYVFHQGDKGEFLYVLLSGGIQIVNEREYEKVIGLVKPGDAFGHYAFITGKVRAMGARASTDTQVLKLDYDTYARFLMQHMERQVRGVAEQLRLVEVLQGIPQSTEMSLAATVTRKFYRHGQRVHTQAFATLSADSADAKLAPQMLFL